MEKKYTVSQVANGYVIIPGSKRSINGKDLNVFNEFRDMVCYLEKKFNIYSAESYSVELANKYLHEQAERMADEITEEDHEKLRKSRETIHGKMQKFMNLI